jgi:hypothetical protein
MEFQSVEFQSRKYKETPSNRAPITRWSSPEWLWFGSRKDCLMSPLPDVYMVPNECVSPVYLHLDRTSATGPSSDKDTSGIPLLSSISRTIPICSSASATDDWCCRGSAKSRLKAEVSHV